MWNVIYVTCNNNVCNNESECVMKKNDNNNEIKIWNISIIIMKANEK